MDPEKDITGGRRQCTRENSVICALHIILLGQLNQEVETSATWSETAEMRNSYISAL
jgi:hypothetical protein